MIEIKRLSGIHAFLQRVSQQADRRLNLGRLAKAPYDQTLPVELRRSARELTSYAAGQISINRLDPIRVADQAVAELAEAEARIETQAGELTQLRGDLRVLRDQLAAGPTSEEKTAWQTKLGELQNQLTAQEETLTGLRQQMADYQERETGYLAYGEQVETRLTEFREKVQTARQERDARPTLEEHTRLQEEIAAYQESQKGFDAYGEQVEQRLNELREKVKTARQERDARPTLEEHTLLQTEISLTRQIIARFDAFWDEVDPKVLINFRLVLNQVVGSIKQNTNLSAEQQKELISGVLFLAVTATDRALAPIREYKDRAPEEALAIIRQIFTMMGDFLSLDPQQRNWLDDQLVLTRSSDQQIAALPVPQQFKLLGQRISDQARQQALSRLATHNEADIWPALDDIDPEVRHGARATLTARLSLYLSASAQGNQQSDQMLMNELRSRTPDQLALIRTILSEQVARSAWVDEPAKQLASQLALKIKKGWGGLGSWQLS